MQRSAVAPSARGPGNGAVSRLSTHAALQQGVYCCLLRTVPWLVCRMPAREARLGTLNDTMAH